jgi:hypothetical protein
MVSVALGCGMRHGEGPERETEGKGPKGKGQREGAMTLVRRGQP